ncbi:MAG: hypothetical protein WC869_00200 [Phycisphaerae bacterium]|jgi:hypothetical protein
MTATTEPVDTKKFLAPDEILRRAREGAGGLIVWRIDAAYPEEGPFCDKPRVGRCYVMYTLEDGTWCNIPYKSAKALAISIGLTLESPTTEWATVYDDPPQDDEERPHGIQLAGERSLIRLMAYRGRIWQFLPKGMVDPFDDGVECEIADFSMNDVGSCAYCEKKNGVYEMVIG